MKTLVMGDTPMIDAPDWLMGYSMMAPFTLLSHDVAGIGYSVYYYAANMQPLETVSMIAIDGVVPSVSSIADGSYPLVTEVFAVVRAEDDNSAGVLVDWLRTADGQAAIEATGYVALP
jgi:phosphate transport system substrate-binding protein